MPASWAPLLDVLRGEIWVVPVLVSAGFLACILILFEIYLLVHTLRSRHASSRRHLFLGQVRKKPKKFAWGHFGCQIVNVNDQNLG